MDAEGHNISRLHHLPGQRAGACIFLYAFTTVSITGAAFLVS